MRETGDYKRVRRPEVVIRRGHLGGWLPQLLKPHNDRSSAFPDFLTPFLHPWGSDVLKSCSADAELDKALNLSLRELTVKIGSLIEENPRKEKLSELGKHKGQVSTCQGV